jgi:hypothetical protein
MNMEYKEKKPILFPTKGSCNSQDSTHENICKTHQCQNCYENTNYIIELPFNHVFLLQLTLEHLVL